MAKDAYYFSHDSNAKDDPKCVLLIEQLGLEGYGIFWMLIETLRDQPGYKYPIALISALARRYNTTAEKVKTVVNSYGLFTVDEQDFFSLSLMRRMEHLDYKRELARIAGKKSAEKRLLLNSGSTGVQPTLNEGSTSKVNKSKVKESKKKDIYISCQHLSMTEEEYKKLVETYGEETVKDKLEYAENYAKLKNYKSLYLTLSNWLKADKKKEGKNGTDKQPNRQSKPTFKFDKTKFLAPGTF
jgi:hypothetical protein